MRRKPSEPLPDLEDDAVFRAKMRPLLDHALPSDRKPGSPDIRIIEETGKESRGRVQAAQEQEQIEARRGRKRRFEYLIPERVGRALADDANSRSVSATTRLLEVLRDAGYPVIPEDLVDLRKMPKR